MNKLPYTYAHSKLELLIGSVVHMHARTHAQACLRVTLRSVSVRALLQHMPYTLVADTHTHTPTHILPQTLQWKFTTSRIYLWRTLCSCCFASVRLSRCPFFFGVRVSLRALFRPLVSMSAMRCVYPSKRSS